MASTLIITQTLTGLRRDLPTTFDDTDSTLAGILTWIRDTADANRPDVEGVGNVSVSFEVGTTVQLVPDVTVDGLGPTGAVDDPVGTLELRIRLPIPDELAFDITNPANPLADFLEAIFGGINGYFDELGPDAAAFLAATGITGPDNVIKLHVAVAKTDWAPA